MLLKGDVFCKLLVCIKPLVLWKVINLNVGKVREYYRTVSVYDARSKQRASLDRSLTGSLVRIPLKALSLYAVLSYVGTALATG